MKGIVFNALAEAVTAAHGADMWDDIVDSAGVAGAYTALGTYDDCELSALVAAASEITGNRPEDLFLSLGQLLVRGLMSHVTDMIDRDLGVFHFISTIEHIIHVEVRKLAPDANPPTVLAERVDESTLRVVYRSDRGLDALAAGLLHGAGLEFDEPLRIDRQQGSNRRETVFVIQREDRP